MCLQYIWRSERGGWEVKGHTSVRICAFVHWAWQPRVLISRLFCAILARACNYQGLNIIDRTSKACAISLSSSSDNICVCQ